jgi:DDE superfamily endonuclease
MENVLDVYKRPYDPLRPVVCMDESPKQLIAETRVPLPPRPGRVELYDAEYQRLGVCDIFIAYEPLTGTRLVQVTETRGKKDWARFVREIADRYKDAERITLVMDNLVSHEPGSLYEVFPPEEARTLWNRFEFVYTPKHGSWLNIAEIELSILHRQCLNRRIDNIEQVRKQIQQWTNSKNDNKCTINWQFTAKDARTKLKRLYPTINT